MRLGLDLRSIADAEQRCALAVEADRLGLWAVLLDSTIEAAALAPLTEHVHLAVVADAEATQPIDVAEAIAVNIRDMSALKVPIITIIIGEGGSGGALGIAVADEVMIFENAYYSVISPEGCAAILWKDRASAPKAAEALKFSPAHLKGFGVVDQILPEPTGGAHCNYDTAASTLKTALLQALQALEKKSLKKLLDDRYAKFRGLGQFTDAG